MKYFSYAHGVVAIIPKKLWHCYSFIKHAIQGDSIIQNANGLWSQSGQKGGPAWITNRIVTIGMIKFYSLRGELINIWSEHGFMPVTGQRVIQVIDYKKQHILLWVFLLYVCMPVKAGRRQQL